MSVSADFAAVACGVLFVLGVGLGRLINVAAERVPWKPYLGGQLQALCNRLTCYAVREAGWPVVGPLTASGARVFGGRRRGVRAAVVELGNGLLLAALYLHEVPAGDAASVGGLHSALAPAALVPGWSATTLWVHLRFLLHAVLVQALLLATLIDFDLQIIPDAATVPAGLFALAVSFAAGAVFVVPVWFQDSGMVGLLHSLLPPDAGRWLGATAPDSPIHVGRIDVPGWVAARPHWHGLAVSVAGLLVGGGLVWLVRIVGGLVLRREAMGFGDVVLLAMVGSFLGWQPVVIVFFLAPLCALVVAAVTWIVARESEIPYGPYLSLATVVLLFGWERIWPATVNVFALGPLLPVVALLMTGLLFLSLQFVQLLKSLLGVPLYEEEVFEEWSSADQLQYLSMERDHPDPRRPEGWPGTAAGRGALHERRWRGGP